MNIVVNLVRERDWENARWEDQFIARDCKNPEQSLRDAVREFLLTDDGEQCIKDSSNDFNWGDAIMYVPERFWNKHGLSTVGSNEHFTAQGHATITVDQDEVLIPNEYWEKEEE